MGRPSQAALVRQWNERHLVGTKVRYWKGAKRGEPSGEAPTTGPATLLGGHTAIVWLDGVVGCIAVDHIEAVGKPVAVEVPAGWAATGGSS